MIGYAWKRSRRLAGAGSRDAPRPPPFEFGDPLLTEHMDIKHAFPLADEQGFQEMMNRVLNSSRSRSSDRRTSALALPPPPNRASRGVKSVRSRSGSLDLAPLQLDEPEPALENLWQEQNNADWLAEMGLGPAVPPRRARIKRAYAALPPPPPPPPQPLVPRRARIKQGYYIPPVAPAPPPLIRQKRAQPQRAQPMPIPDIRRPRLKRFGQITDAELERLIREARANEPGLEVRLSTIPTLGRGLFARPGRATEVVYRKGTALAEYTGKLYEGEAARRFLDRKYGSSELVAPYAVARQDGAIIDPPASSRHWDARHPERFMKAQFANDCTLSVAHRSGACHLNNTIFVERMGRVFLVADRDITAGEEIFVSYGPRYWSSGRAKVVSVVYRYLSGQREEHPEKTFTAAQLLYTLWPQLTYFWGQDRPTRALQQMQDALRVATNKGVFARTRRPIPQTPEQWRIYKLVHNGPMRGYFRAPPKKPNLQYQFRLAAHIPTATV